MDEDRVAALGGEAVHDDQHHPEAEAPSPRDAKRAARAGGEARDGHAGARPRDEQRVRCDEGRQSQRPDVGARGGSAAVAEWPRPVPVGEGGPHSPLLVTTGSAISRPEVAATA